MVGKLEGNKVGKLEGIFEGNLVPSSGWSIKKKLINDRENVFGNVIIAFIVDESWVTSG